MAIATQKAAAAELAELRLENKKLKEEVEVLRKASAFFGPTDCLDGGDEDMRTKFAFIAAHTSEHTIRFMCRVIGRHPQLLLCLAARGTKEGRALPGVTVLGPRSRQSFCRARSATVPHEFMPS